MFDRLEKMPLSYTTLVEGIVDRELGEHAREIVPLVGNGSVNTLYRCKAGQLDVVVRMNDVVRGRLDYRKERWCIESASRHGIPGPVVLAVGEVEDTAYMVMETVPGRNGKQCGRDPLDLLGVLGRYARAIHGIPVTGFGNELADERTGAFTNSHSKSWRAYVEYNVSELAPGDPLIRLGAYQPQDRDLIAETFERLLGADVAIGLNHCDLAIRNTIVGEDGHVVLLDWGCATAHVAPFCDLSHLCGWYGLADDRFEAFLNGYAESAAEAERIRVDVPKFTLLTTFDTARWAIDHANDRVSEYVERAATAVRRIKSGPS